MAVYLGNTNAKRHNEGNRDGAGGDTAGIKGHGQQRIVAVYTVKPADVIIVEGILIFTCPELRKQMDIKLFVDADDDDRVMRVISRDIAERGKTAEWVIERYTKTVKPMYLQFIEPSKRYADIIIPQGGHNKVAIDVISATVEKALNCK